MSSTVTCHTAACENEGHAIDLELDHVNPDTGATERVGSVVCGACGQPITDIIDP